MFMNRSAWFSSSVSPASQNFWIVEGGRIAGWRTADYLFSKDATCPDTVRIYESKDYLWNNVVVFHSLFLSTCEKRQSVRSVCIGHYVLPPTSVQDEVRKVVGRLIWETRDEPSGIEGSQAGDEESDISRSNSEPFETDSLESEASLCAYLEDYPVNDMLAGYVSMENLPKYSGDMCDYHPGCLQCSNCKAPCCLPHT